MDRQKNNKQKKKAFTEFQVTADGSVVVQLPDVEGEDRSTPIPAIYPSTSQLQNQTNMQQYKQENQRYSTGGQKDSGEQQGSQQPQTPQNNQQIAIQQPQQSELKYLHMVLQQSENQKQREKNDLEIQNLSPLNCPAPQSPDDSQLGDFISNRKIESILQQQFQTREISSAFTNAQKNYQQQIEQQNNQVNQQQQSLRLQKLQHDLTLQTPGYRYKELLAGRNISDQYQANILEQLGIHSSLQQSPYIIDEEQQLLQQNNINQRHQNQERVLQESSFSPSSTSQNEQRNDLLSSQEMLNTGSSASNQFEFDVKVGAAMDIGARSAMEDDYLVVMDLGDQYRQQKQIDVEIPDLTLLFAVFDGHNGREVVDITKKLLVSKIIESQFFPTNIPQALISSLDEVDKEYYSNLYSKDFMDSSGTTATIVIIWGLKLYVANLGDSRFILQKRGECLISTKDHKVSNKKEFQRVREQGGFFDEDGLLNEMLQVTRALGDFEDTLKKLTQHNTFKGPLSNVPEILEIQLCTKDEFFILASDGLWEQLDAIYVARYVQTGLLQEYEPQPIVDDLIRKVVYEEKGRDNVSIILVGLQPPKKLGLRRLKIESIQEISTQIN